ncbi:MAG: hypothetical protein U5N86_12125 [Planctomycetota bacterium]|nr:hypothetical protein [Planctomycetota bacterium]
MFFDINSSGSLAAVMLAAAHRQLLATGDLSIENPAATVSESVYNEYRKKLVEVIDELEVPYRKLFDDLDYFTFACDYPGSVNLFSRYDKAPYPVDDCVFRNADDARWGFPGRLLGGEARKLYQANCSLFLSTDDVFFFDRYGGGGGFGQHSAETGAPILENFGLSTDVVKADATLDNWRMRHSSRASYDMLYVNSSGGGRNWSLKGKGASYEDIPLTKPLIVHFTHSFSASNPYNRDTIAGRWIHNGAFIYTGSHREPLLGAFNTPKDFAEEATEGYPLSLALHKKMGDQFWTPWKLYYVGDPLYCFTSQRKFVKSEPVLDSAREAKKVYDLAKRRSAIKLEDKIERNLLSLRTAVATGEYEDALKAVDKMFDYFDRRRKVEKELAALFCESAIAYGAALENHELIAQCVEVASKHEAVNTEMGFWLYETAKLKMNGILKGIDSGEMTPEKAADELVRAVGPLMVAKLDSSGSKHFFGRLKELLNLKKLKGSKAKIKKALVELAPKDSDMAKEVNKLK